MAQNIYDTPAGYTCESHLRDGETKCKPKASLAKVMCGREISRDEAIAFFNEPDENGERVDESREGRDALAHLEHCFGDEHGQAIGQLLAGDRHLPAVGGLRRQRQGQPCEQGNQGMLAHVHLVEIRG